ncbi:MAG: hypothetical protein GX491_03600 [Chloroflexi bacterium]|nr:hypothetical protein [Chloroflexota bacterium]
MRKYSLISAALSLGVILLLLLHSMLVQTVSDPELANMIIGLPIGLATAVNIEIIMNKIRRGR